MSNGKGDVATDRQQKREAVARCARKLSDCLYEFLDLPNGETACAEWFDALDGAMDALEKAPREADG
jgi:hypothetical protein